MMVATVIPATRAQPFVKNGCPSQCGNVTIPYPFGTKEGCFLNHNFYIHCDESIACLAHMKLIITDVAIEGQLRVLTTVARDCYRAPRLPFLTPETTIPLSSLSIYNISSTRNKLTAIGCNTYGYLKGYIGNKSYSSGCMSLCDQLDELIIGSCTGFECCRRKSIFVMSAITFTNFLSMLSISMSAKFRVDNAICKNLPGSFKCICKDGYEGHGKRNGTGCTPISLSV
ncbi:hypothetical protein Goari_019024 [Gossypium aridum]|uniref:EGF-like calcium-binding domain-containing protein n=1 Tax=Gossypium aridum TaxID=34290 RepID=A0A7J8WRF6_GOSAI|nr:hypothetical protein [Gossypium aridum]